MVAHQGDVRPLKLGHYLRPQDLNLQSLCLRQPNGLALSRLRHNTVFADAETLLSLSVRRHPYFSPKLGMGIIFTRNSLENRLLSFQEIVCLRLYRGEKKVSMFC